MNLTKQTNRFFLIYFIYFILFGYVFYLIPFVSDLSINGQGILGQLLSSGLPIVLYFVVTRKNPKTVLRIRSLDWKNVLMVIVFGFIIQPLMQLLAFAASLVFPNLVADTFMSLENENMFITLLSMAIIPAIIEELLLRGIFLSGYRNLGRKKAIFCTALLFGMLHLNPQQFFYAFGAGLFFCFLAERSGSIFASIIPHFIVNGTNVVTFYFSQSMGSDTAEVASTFSNMDMFLYCLGSALISLPFLIGLIYLFLKNNPSKYDLPKEYREKFLSPSIYLIFLLTFVFGVVPYLSYVL